MIPLHGSSFDGRGDRGPYHTASSSSSRSGWPDARSSGTPSVCSPPPAARSRPCSPPGPGSAAAAPGFLSQTMASPPSGGDAMVANLAQRPSKPALQPPKRPPRHQPGAGRSGGRRADDGDRLPPAGGTGHPSFRSRFAVTRRWRSVSGAGRRASCSRWAQWAMRTRTPCTQELLRDARVRTPRPATVPDGGRGAARSLQLHRGLL